MEGYIGYHGYLIEERADGSFHVYGERAETKIFDDAISLEHAKQQIDADMMRVGRTPLPSQDGERS